MITTKSNKTVMAKVLDVRQLTESTAVVRFERKDIAFKAGQYVSIGLEGRRENREYSIYSGPDEPHLEILIKDVEGGVLSPFLCAAKPGDIFRVAGPYGYFTIKDADEDKPFLFIATGTGISPFRSLVSAYPSLNYRLFHGVSYKAEQYDRDFYGEHYTGCISREDDGDYYGRVTPCINEQDVSADTLCYLCGNCDMIYDVFDILIAKGVHPDNLHAEVYY